MKRVELFNESGFHRYSGEAKGSIPRLTQKAVEMNYERSDCPIRDVENQLYCLTGMVGRFMEIEALKGRVTAAELGYALGIVNPENTKFVITPGFNKKPEPLPVDEEGRLL
jgi:hypothetical protein